jgi:hypothetical protein
MVQNPFWVTFFGNKVSLCRRLRPTTVACGEMRVVLLRQRHAVMPEQIWITAMSLLCQLRTERGAYAEIA